MSSSHLPFHLEYPCSLFCSSGRGRERERERCRWKTNSKNGGGRRVFLVAFQKERRRWILFSLWVKIELAPIEPLSIMNSIMACQGWVIGLNGLPLFPSSFTLFRYFPFCYRFLHSSATCLLFISISNYTRGIFMCAFGLQTNLARQTPTIRTQNTCNIINISHNICFIVLCGKFEVKIHLEWLAW